MFFIEILGGSLCESICEDFDEPEFACPITQLSRSRVTQHVVAVSADKQGHAVEFVFMFLEISSNQVDASVWEC